MSTEPYRQPPEKTFEELQRPGIDILEPIQELPTKEDAERWWKFLTEMVCARMSNGAQGSAVLNCAQNEEENYYPKIADRMLAEYKARFSKVK